MISQLRVRGFKRFVDVTVPLRSLTTLTGLNGAGKSTLIQALLLARQAVNLPEGAAVALNDAFGMELGRAVEVLNDRSEPQEITIALSYGSGHCRVTLLPDNDVDALYLRRGATSGSAPATLTGSGLAFTYLSAERLGPRHVLAAAAEPADRLGLGEQGQYTAQVLALKERDEVLQSLQHPMTPERRGRGVVTLKTQVELWMSDIVRPVRVEARGHPELVASSLWFRGMDRLTEWLRPANMGFGVTYSLPIIVAGLAMPPGSLLVVENPEAHLHPAGQSRLGRFLARVAGAGIQVLVETHSDHMINGLRLGVSEDRVLTADRAIIHFFSDEPSQAPVAIDVDPRGSLSTWPEGFFDQLEADLGSLSRAKRSR